MTEGLCPNCRKPLPENARFCVECGSRIDVLMTRRELGDTFSEEGKGLQVDRAKSVVSPFYSKNDRLKEKILNPDLAPLPGKKKLVFRSWDEIKADNGNQAQRADDSSETLAGRSDVTPVAESNRTQQTEEDNIEMEDEEEIVGEIAPESNDVDAEEASAEFKCDEEYADENAQESDDAAVEETVDAAPELNPEVTEDTSYKEFAEAQLVAEQQTVAVDSSLEEPKGVTQICEEDEVLSATEENRKKELVETDRNQAVGKSQEESVKPTDSDNLGERLSDEVISMLSAESEDAPHETNNSDETDSMSDQIEKGLAERDSQEAAHVVVPEMVIPPQRQNRIITSSIGGGFGRKAQRGMTNVTTTRSPGWPTMGNRFCIYCGNRLEAGTRFCIACEKKDVSQNCPECGNSIKHEMNFCPKCGFDLR